VYAERSKMNTETARALSGGLEDAEARKLEDIGSYAARITTEGAVIDEVTGEEVKPVVTLKTWIVVMVGGL
jgi:hypothetical protein